MVVDIILEISSFCGDIHIPWILSSFSRNIKVRWILYPFCGYIYTLWILSPFRGYIRISWIPSALATLQATWLIILVMLYTVSLWSWILILVEVRATQLIISVLFLTSYSSSESDWCRRLTFLDLIKPFDFVVSLSFLL